MEKYYLQFENCRQWEKPPCSNGCPFEFDILDFQAKTASGRISAAYKTFRNATGFPEIVGAACPGYCEQHCARTKTDNAVQLHLMEQSTLALTKRKKPNQYNLPPKKGKFAIVGAGISGLGCLLRLTSRKYSVTIYEQSDRIGGQLHNMLPEELFMEDINNQLQYEEYDLQLNTQINSLDDIPLEEFNAVYVATGNCGNALGLTPEENYCRIVNGTAIIGGGSLRGLDMIQSLAEGMLMARAVDVFFMTGKLEPPPSYAPSKVVVNDHKLLPSPAVEGTADGLLTEDELARESSRCIRCQCDNCRTYCDLTDFYNKWPLQMRDEIITAAKPSESMLHKTPAMHLINACTQCGLCEDTCPGEIKLGEMISYARQRLHTQGKTPHAFRQFWLRDMDYSNGEHASICRTAPGYDKASYTFFPGCHLGATDPEYVTRTYNWLLSKQPDTGLMLRCCNIPALWDGDVALHLELMRTLKKQWESQGCPIIITACSSCQAQLREYLPEASTISLFEIMEEWGYNYQGPGINAEYAVFDPCSARNITETQDSVRNLLAATGVSLSELPDGDKHGCCGFGGHGDIGEPKFTHMVTTKRAELSDKPYLVYCANCRNYFLNEGKEATHALNLLFDIAEVPVPTPSAYRMNRVILKEKLLNNIWSENMSNKPETIVRDLIISPEIQRKICDLRLLEEDIANIIASSEANKRRTRDDVTGYYKCYGEIGYITCWVEYNITEDNRYEIINLYTHRMKIVVEAVWNGRKTEEFEV